MTQNNSKKPIPLMKSKEIAKIILGSIIWVILLGLTFFTYYAIPGFIFLSWIIIAWLIKAFKGDKHDGSAYDEEF